MSEDLYRLVYYSRTRMGEEVERFADGVRSVLATSQRNNAPAGVTGALLFNAGCFGQVLEGSRRAVEATFERIQRDPRHSDVSLLGFDAIDARAFPNWAMGFVGTRAADAERYGGIAVASGYDPSRMSADHLFETLHRLALEEEHSAVA
ncbi:BLUF domain-containing protein [Sphingomonas jatrophae]|uniref:Sensors of blue-light using FAD n=1 Tax=Sphingomonas jatrophae TaxID=1166337 RepID=A0A1I6M804_9SPHN|nr:BLUF domain-containing protein [Sphingomonas jatrophae]SFS11839.1 Sensors of blue-light using FAD [Sphingomonas jatrophae]